MSSDTKNINIDALLAKLTLQEKISLLSAKDWWRTPVIKREGVFVPHLKSTDGPNGSRGESYVSGIRAACFPCSTNLGATFDVDVVYNVGLEIAKEAITKSANILLAPTLNVIRSPLGGRNYETYSEDPTVLGLLSAAFVNGCQSIGIAATPKHFVANDAEDRRLYLTAEIDEQTLREIYLYPFQLIMKHANPLCFMTSYNRVNGKYTADDARLLENILRKEWGFTGAILSDWGGTYSTATGLNAGVDLEMPGPTKWRGEKLLRCLEDGSVTESTINKSARRILALAKALDRFENPNEAPEYEAINSQRDSFIRDTAAEGMVLLKNQNEILPIPRDASVTVIGHLAQVVSLGGGGSAKVNAIRAVTPLEGLDSLGVKSSYEPGVPIFGAVPLADPAIISITGGSLTQQQKKAVRLEWFNGPEIGKNLAHEEMIVSAEYMIKEAWPKYLDADFCTRMTFNITPQTSGNHILSIISTGKARCYIDGKEVFVREQETDLKLESFYMFKAKLERRFTYYMKAGQQYTLLAESWACDPRILNSEKLKGMMFQGTSLRFFEHVDITAAIARAADTAAKTEYAIVCVGTTNEFESEGYDRDTMDLPGAQYDLILAVAAQNTRTVVVNFSGSPVSMTQFIDYVPSVVQAWFPGQECGHSIASILTGKINPSGRLPMSWPKRIEDNPSYGNFPVDSHDVIRYAEGLDIGYRHYDRKESPEPHFPFGYGLSYTTFEISNVQASALEMSPGNDGSIEISCLVRNSGRKEGKLVLQFYIQMPETTIGQLRPLKELKAFCKVHLIAGQTKTVKIKLDRNSISFYDAEHASWLARKGSYVVHVGTSSVDIAANVNFLVPLEFSWTGV